MEKHRPIKFDEDGIAVLNDDGIETDAQERRDRRNAVDSLAEEAIGKLLTNS